MAVHAPQTWHVRQPPWTRDFILPRTKFDLLALEYVLELFFYSYWHS